MATCRSCGASILWTVTENGKRMPIDSERQPGDPATGLKPGNLVLTGRRLKGSPQVHVLAADEADDPRPRWVSHFVTCPNSAAHRRKP